MEPTIYQWIPASWYNAHVEHREPNVFLHLIKLVE